MNIRSDDKKQRILDATLELIAENGLHATPMSQVSERSGVSAGAIYHHFSSKEALINHLYLDIKREIVNTVLRGYDIRVSYRERFFIIWKNYFNFLISNPIKLSFLEQCSTSPLISKEAKEAGEKFAAPLIGFVMEGIESGYIKNLDVRLIFFYIHGTVVSIAKLQLSDKMEMTEKQMEETAQTCWDGLKIQ